MSEQRIERTSIWRNTLAVQNNDNFSHERERLRNAFWQFRKQTSFLVKQISSAIPELTQHDITHLDVLWETASLRR
jgi:hypothetical protein